MWVWGGAANDGLRDLLCVHVAPEFIWRLLYALVCRIFQFICDIAPWERVLVVEVACDSGLHLGAHIVVILLSIAILAKGVHVSLASNRHPTDILLSVVGGSGVGYLLEELAL